MTYFLHYQGSNKPWTVNGVFGKYAKYYHYYFKKYELGEYHITSTWKKEAFLQFINNVITFKKNAENKFQICINNEFVESKIRSTTISNNVSTVATIKEIRDYVLKLQREIAQNKSIVMDGRDIGSVVFPNAEYKFYLDASLKNRSKRRWTELKDGEKNITITTVESDLENRDIIDSNRVHSPLVIPENAIVINSDDLSINQVLKKILHFIK